MKQVSVADIADNNDVVISSDDQGEEEEIGDDAGGVDHVTTRSGRRTAKPSLILKPWLARRQLCRVSVRTSPDTIPWVNEPPGRFTPVTWKSPSKEATVLIMKQSGVAHRLQMYECSRQQYLRDKKNARAVMHFERKKMEKMNSKI